MSTITSGNSRWARLTAFALALLLGTGTASAATDIAVGNAGISEGHAGSKVLDFVLTRTGGSGKAIVVTVETNGGSTDPATEGEDYGAIAAGTKVVIPAGAATATVPVTIHGDTQVEPDETLFLHLTAAAEEGPDYGARTYSAGPCCVDGLAVGDLDGDGTPDLATVDTDKLYVLLGDGAGGVGSPVAYAAGDSPAGVAVGDLDGDGELDLAVANTYGDEVSVLLNDGSGGFVLAASYTAGSEPSGVAIGDLDGDGDGDLAVANYSSGDVSVLINNGSGAFGAAADYPVADAATSVAIGDLDGDGTGDLAVGTDDSDSVSVLLNDGTGLFGSAVFYAAGSPFTVALGDLNDDARLDLVTANPGHGSVSVLLGDGAGGFAVAVSYPVGQDPSTVAIGDLDADGDPDLVTASRGGEKAVVLLNAGDGTMAGAVGFTAGAHARLVGIADFDGDGAPDVVVGGSRIVVLRNAGSGSLAAARSYTAANGAFAIGTGDFNGDALPDLAVANYHAHNVSVLLSSGSGAYAAPVNYAVGTHPHSIAVGDLDDDGNADLVVANSGSHTVSVLLGNADGSFDAAASHASGDLTPKAVVIADLNGDDLPDLATANQNGGAGGGTVGVLLGDNSGSFAAAVIFPTGSTYPGGLAPTDFDGDGQLDLAVTSSGSDDLRVLRNIAAPGASQPSFAAAVVIAAGDNHTRLTVSSGDLDGDGASDLVTANMSLSSVSVLLNQTMPGAETPSYAAAASFATGSSPRAVAIADLDGDGKPDLATADGNGSSASVLLGDGSGSFANAVRYVVGKGPASLVAADLDGDGRLDLATANHLGHDVSVLLAAAPGAVTISTNEGVGTIVNDDSAIDTTPDAFSFPAVEGVSPSMWIKSGAATIAGISGKAPVSVTNGEYRIHNGTRWLAWTTAAGTISSGKQVQLRHVSAALPSKTRTTTLTIGGVNGRFRSTTTVANDTTPDAFAFDRKADVAPATRVRSNYVVVTGTSAPAPVSVAGGEYQIHDGADWNAWTSGAGSVAPGQAVRVRHTSAGAPDRLRHTDLTIGGVTGRFTSRTQGP